MPAAGHREGAAATLTRASARGLRRGFCSAIATIMLLGCPKLSRDETLQLREWQLCDDCSAATRRRVAALEERKVVPALRHDLLSGPDSSRIVIMRRQLTAEYAAVPGRTMAQNDFVTRYLVTYVTVVRVRSAMSLGDIGSPGALDALREALARHQSGRDTLPRSVEAAVERALAAAAPPFDGSLSDSLVNFLDTVTVRPRAGTRWTAPRLALRGAPFAEAVQIGASTRDSLRLIAAAEPGAYALVVTDSGAAGPPQREVVRLRIASLRYTAHDTSTAPNIGAGPFPLVRFFALGTGGSLDSAEVFRLISPVLAQTATMTVRWRGPGTVTLRQFGLCLAPLPAAGPPRRTGLRSETLAFGLRAGATCFIRATYSGPPGAFVVASAVIDAH